MIGTIWQPESLIWVVAVTLGLALVMALTPTAGTSDIVSLAVRFGLLAFAGIWIAMLTLFLLYVARAGLERLTPVGVAWVGLAALVASALAVTGAAYGVAASLFVELAPGELLWRSAAVALTVGLLGVASFQAMWQKRALQERAQRSEAAALQARTSPHFLFNTLNTAVMLVKQRPEQVECLLLNLADLFRAAIAGRQIVDLSDELDLVQKYLDIETLRFGDRLQVRWDRPEPLPEVPVPMLCIQSLVENAVLHGIQPQPQGGTLSIAVEVLDAGCDISIRNPLPSAQGKGHEGHGIGLEAVRERLRGMGEPAGRLETRTEDGQFVARLWLPPPKRDTAAVDGSARNQAAATTS